MSEQWKELKETIVELRDGDGTGTQQEVCKFLVNYMGILEKQMQEPCDNAVLRQAVLDIVDSYSESQSNVEDVTQDIISDIMALSPVTSQEPCEMTAEKYRQRMIQAFHNANTDELIALCVLPTEKEFEHLEWLLKTHYKKEPCKNAIGREDMLDAIGHGTTYTSEELQRIIKGLPPVNPQPKTGHWIKKDGYSDCSECGSHIVTEWDYCPKCGAKMEG